MKKGERGQEESDLLGFRIWHSGLVPCFVFLEDAAVQTSQNDDITPTKKSKTLRGGKRLSLKQELRITALHPAVPFDSSNPTCPGWGNVPFSPLAPPAAPWNRGGNGPDAFQARQSHIKRCLATVCLQIFERYVVWSLFLPGLLWVSSYTGKCLSPWWDTAEHSGFKWL